MCRRFAPNITHTHSTTHVVKFAQISMHTFSLHRNPPNNNPQLVDRTATTAGPANKVQSTGTG